MGAVLALLLLGVALGARHALDPDHVVAVTTIVSRERTLRRAAVVGALWGLGHGVTILVVGGAIIAFGVVVPPRVGLTMELGVALMLIVLGATSLKGSTKTNGHHHDHGGTKTDHRRGVLRRLRPVAVGIVHGLAGSGAVALMILATIREPRWALAYLLLFGAGTVLGMVALTLVVASPFAFTAVRFARLNDRLAELAAVGSVLVGLVIAWQIVAHHGLFSSAPRWSPQ